jgi:hypothetical protein
MRTTFYVFERPTDGREYLVETHKGIILSIKHSGGDIILRQFWNWHPVRSISPEYNRKRVKKSEAQKMLVLWELGK